MLCRGGRGVNFSQQSHAAGLGFVKKKILKILAGTARVVVTYFSQYSGSKVQNFAIIGQLWHAIFPDKCMQSTWFIYHFVERNKSCLNHTHICFATRARAAKCLYLGAIFTPKNRSPFSIMQTDFWLKSWDPKNAKFMQKICGFCREKNS